ncbi:MAG: hypothetical protein GX493_10745 [Firmicutes bacterium]|nr:hypothetical protein [Bacillota bacterium]
MALRYAYLSLDGPWTIEGMEFEEGLARRAYDPTYQPRNPVPAKVPCIVQAALFEAGLVEDPYFEMNAEKLLWVEDKEWWFFKEFTVPEEVAGRKYELVFEGITYRANVWLNGISLGHLEGMFLRHRLDVTRLIVPGQKNVLVLRLRALEHSSEDRPGGKVKRGMVRSSGVVAPFTYWWNWAPHIVPIGIWKSVWLRVTGGASIQDPFVRTKIEWDECEEAARAEVKIGLEVESSFAGQERVRILGRITGVDFTCPAIEFKRDLILSPGVNQIELETAIERPKLWWPNGMGPHHLYRLELMILDEERNVLDRAETEFGVRELTMLKNQDDLWVQEVHGQSNRLWSIVGNPYPWTFCINRQRFFVRGDELVTHGQPLSFLRGTL